MSFMFNPYPYVDPEAVNVPELSPELTQSVTTSTAAIAKQLRDSVPAHGVLALDGYIGAEFGPLLERMAKHSSGACMLPVAEAYKSSTELDAMLKDSLPEDRRIDPVLLFGKCVHREIESLFDSVGVERLRRQIAEKRRAAEPVIVYGQGAACSLFRDLEDCAAFLDVTPLVATYKTANGRNFALGDSEKRDTRYTFRRLYYYDYEIMMLHRKNLIDGRKIDFYIDANQENDLKLLPLDALLQLFDEVIRSPFRCTPVYLEGVWGGTFVKQLRHLPADMRNCAWVFDMIPNEVSLQIRAGSHTLNIPFSTFFKARSKELMGEESVRKFGCVFPIRFNYDDTYGGSGNMSIQVHPPQAYSQAQFGEPFQQDESYYCVRTAGSKTYLGLQDDCRVEDFSQCLDRAEKDQVPFDHDRYVNSFPSEEGDQFLIPGGTVHASGRNQVILEIGSYTIGSYTFKLYDYLRKDLNGNPRPIHSIHGKNVLVTERRRAQIDGVLRPKPRVIRSGNGWKEEIIGEHDLIYFSLRRFTFDRSIADTTQGVKFHVLVLVKGDEILIYAKADPTRCYHARFMDMVVIPASLGDYGIINLGKTPCQVTKTMLK